VVSGQAASNINVLLPATAGTLALTSAIPSTPYSVNNGGTGRSSHTAYAVLCGGTTTTGAQQSVASVGTSGQVLTSNGPSALPSFQTVAATMPDDYVVLFIAGPTTCFTDTGATTPAAAGDLVAAIKDSSGVIRATQSTSGLRPILRQDGASRYYLEFDGSDDLLNGVDMAIFWNGDATVSAAVRVTAAGSFPMIVVIYSDANELRCNGSSGNPELLSDNSNTPQIAASCVGADTVLTGISRTSAGAAEIWRDGATVARASGAVSLGRGGIQLTIGNRPGGGYPATMRFYGLAIYNRALPASERSKLDTYMGTLIGLTI
jgi:hypothetical protein